MTFLLTSEQSQLIQDAIASGVIRTPEDVIALGLERLRSRIATNAAGVSGSIKSSPAHLQSAESWFTALKEWADSHSTDTPVLSDEAMSRESIYPDRLEPVLVVL